MPPAARPMPCSIAWLVRALLVPVLGVRIGALRGWRAGAASWLGDGRAVVARGGDGVVRERRGAAGSRSSPRASCSPRRWCCRSSVTACVACCRARNSPSRSPRRSVSRWPPCCGWSTTVGRFLRGCDSDGRAQRAHSPRCRAPSSVARARAARRSSRRLAVGGDDAARRDGPRGRVVDKLSTPCCGWSASSGRRCSRRPLGVAPPMPIARSGSTATSAVPLRSRPCSMRPPKPQTLAHAQALRWLEQWAAAKVPGVLGSLRERRPSVRVERPLLAMAVCSALALFVLTLAETCSAYDGRASASMEAASRRQVDAIDRSARRRPDSPARSRMRCDRPRRRASRSADVPAPRQQPVRREPTMAARRRQRRRQRRCCRRTLPTAQPESRSLGAVDGSATTGRGRSAGSLSGHDAGDSPDTRADLGVSRAATGTIAAPRSASTLRLAGAERQADMEQAAGFDESVSTPGGARPGAVVVAAASPPRAVAAARLSPIETSYVQAWMKATGRSR